MRCRVDVEAIHEGLGNAADGLAVTIGDSTFHLKGYPSLPGSITPPVFAPVEFAIDYHQTFGSTGGLSIPVFQCGLFTSLGGIDAGRKMLAAYIGTGSNSILMQALEADKTLGGACKQLIVKRVHGAYRYYTIAGADYLGAMVEVKVWA